VTSLNAFSPEMVQRELARRDQIRDEILTLAETDREAARGAENERQRLWEISRQAHRARWAAAPSSSDLADGRGSTPNHRNRESGYEACFGSVKEVARDRTLKSQ
jgi:hypothetical protein